jgi:hypothetical protein
MRDISDGLLAEYAQELTCVVNFLAELKGSILWLGATELVIARPQPDTVCSQIGPRRWHTPMQHVPLKANRLHGNLCLLASPRNTGIV